MADKITKNETVAEELARLKLKRAKMPANFDSKAFREKHGLSPDDYWAREDADGLHLYYPQHLPDDPFGG